MPSTVCFIALDGGGGEKRNTVDIQSTPANFTYLVYFIMSFVGLILLKHLSN